MLRSVSQLAFVITMIEALSENESIMWYLKIIPYKYFSLPALFHCIQYLVLTVSNYSMEPK